MLINRDSCSSTCTRSRNVRTTVLSIEAHVSVKRSNYRGPKLSAVEPEFLLTLRAKLIDRARVSTQSKGSSLSRYFARLFFWFFFFLFFSFITRVPSTCPKSRDESFTWLSSYRIQYIRYEIHEWSFFFFTNFFFCILDTFFVWNRRNCWRWNW